jgi:2-aminoethylphosphonate-pyruvate transaminase
MSKTEHILPSFNGPPGQPDLPWLMTPGPVTTSRNVKLAMLADFDSGSPEFLRMIDDVSAHLCMIAGGGRNSTCLLPALPRAAVIEGLIARFGAPRRKKTLIFNNGPDAAEVIGMHERLGRAVVRLDKPVVQSFDVADLTKALSFDKDISHVWLVHCEAETGLINPAREICRAAKEAGKTVVLDAGLTLSTLPLSMSVDGIDILLTDAGAALNSVPGLHPIIFKQDLISENQAKSSVSALDLPSLNLASKATDILPHVLCALHEAIREWEAGGGQSRAHESRQAVARALLTRMKGLGFQPLLPEVDSGPLLHSFICPRDAKFGLAEFCDQLRARGFAIAPGRLPQQNTFTVAVMGQVNEKTISAFAKATEDVLKAMDIRELRGL